MKEHQYELEARHAEDHWWWTARREILSKIMRRYLSKGHRYRLLEVGCGTGSNFHMLRQFGDLDGIEMSPIAVGLCRDRCPEFNVMEGAIPIELAQQYDVICLFDVLEHIEDDRMAIQWIHDHVAPGGYVFISVPAYQFLWSRHDEEVHHFRRYTRGNLIKRLGANFAVPYCTYFNTHLFPAVAGIRLVRRILRLPGGESDATIGNKGPLNGALKAVFSAERLWFPTATLPFGVSICAVCQKA